MHQATIQLPVTNDLASTLRFAIDLEAYAMHDKLILDFGERNFYSPFRLLFISEKLKLFRFRNPGILFKFKNYINHTYLSHFGFFRMCGLAHGNEVGEAAGSDNYIPITCLTRSELYQSPGDKYQEVQELIQRHANSVALIIARDKKMNRDMYDALSFSIREVMRNVFEHSEGDELYYSAQFWPAINKVEFTVADFGCGIRKGLSGNPNFRFDTDKEAIECSLLPSVSGKTHLRQTSTTW